MTPTHTKIHEYSTCLGRAFHADLFSGSDPQGVMIVLGGSGQTEASYLSRADSVHPQLLQYFQRNPLAGAHCVYVTAPYDLPFARPELFMDRCEAWNEHLKHDLLALWPDLPIYLVGYSGGIILALSGIQENRRVRGVTGLGADGIPEDVEIPFDAGSHPRWRLELRYCAGDRVRTFNGPIIRELIESEVARVIVDGEGGHDFQSYLKTGAFRATIKSAQQAFAATGAILN